MVSDVALFLVAICLMDITIGQGHTPSRPEPDESSTAQVKLVYIIYIQTLSERTMIVLLQYSA